MCFCCLQYLRKTKEVGKGRNKICTRFVRLTWMTALNQHVFPTFFRPTGKFSFRFLSWGFSGSMKDCQTLPRFRLLPPRDSIKLASKTLQEKVSKVGLLDRAKNIMGTWQLGLQKLSTLENFTSRNSGE